MAGQRPDLAEKEQAEIDVLATYLPKQLTAEEIDVMIDEAIAAVGMTGMAAMGKVMGIEADGAKAGYQIVLAEVPKAEMTDYVISLRAATQGRGRFEFTIDRYDEAPAQVAQKVIAEAKSQAE